MPVNIKTASGGGVILQGANTASDKTITIPADDGTMIYANSSGNVGIGTSSPQQPLDVRGRIQVSNGTAGGQLGVNAGGLAISSIGANPVSFYNNTFGTETARIDSSGNLLVGTTSTSGTSRLRAVSGDRDFSFGQGVGVSNVFTAYLGIANSNGLAIQGTVTSAVAPLQFYNPNGTVGSIVTNGSSTAYNTSSDYRLKENVQPMQGALAKVAALKPCTYTWKADGSNGEGFIAHELAEIVPDAVTGEKDAVNEDGSINPQGIDTSFLVATLTAAIQELKAEVDSLRAQVEAK